MRLEHKLGMLGELVMTTFPAHGGRHWLRVKGRVVEDAALEKPSEDASVLENAWNTFWRLESDEVPGARVRAAYRGGRWETTTDAEGYFAFRLEVEDPLEPGWHDVPLEIDLPLDRGRIDGTARALVPDPDAAFGVISDLDDTVIETGATDAFKEIKMIFGNNARTRPAFPGAAELYRALEAGPTGRGHNPLFYVSLSGWNLYDVFETFMEDHGFPEGPFFMQDLNILEDPSTHIAHADPKLERAAILLENYPDLPFILIGDSGQDDPENYRSVVDRHPGRIRAIYIRDVTSDERDEEVRAIAKEVEAKGVPMILAEDSVAVAEHAAEVGFISGRAVDRVRREVAEARRP